MEGWKKGWKRWKRGWKKRDQCSRVCVIRVINLVITVIRVINLVITVIRVIRVANLVG